jgi:hypothetical protein
MVWPLITGAQLWSSKQRLLQKEVAPMNFALCLPIRRNTYEIKEFLSHFYDIFGNIGKGTDVLQEKPVGGVIFDGKLVYPGR